MRNSKRRKLSIEIVSLTIFSSVCAILVLGFSLIMIFMFFFSKQAYEDMQYYLDNTLQQFDDKFQYIQDGAISIRHNVIMGDFFDKDNYNKNDIETQLNYCLDLFSQRNTLGQNTPFVVNVYIFNNKNDFISNHYYPATLASTRMIDVEYKKLQKEFDTMKTQYHCYVKDDKVDLCFRILDENLKKAGICIVSINKNAIDEVFSSVEKYKNSCWLVLDNFGNTIYGVGTQTQLDTLSKIAPNSFSRQKIDGNMSLCSTLTNGFGVKTAIAIEQNNIYSVLTPTIISFVLAVVIVLAVVTVLIFGVSYRLTKPLKKMADEIRFFGQEDLTMRMQDFSIQEFHDISVVFNEMADRIDHLVTQIYEKELLATRHQVKFLQAQINPHFQFNILAMFSIKAKLAGDEELYQGLRAFSKLIQGKIFREKEIKIPLSDEIELVKFYLYLQKSRFGDKISYEIDCSEDVENCFIPRLLIEPLVENAVSHGLEPKTGNGTIKIKIYEKEEKLHIIVEDDGVGFDEQERLKENVQSVNPSHTFTGLANTRRLLEILYQKNYEMNIKGVLNEGTRVEITVPIERREQKNVEGNGC